MRRILRLSQSGQHKEALHALGRLFDENRSLDDFGWLRRQVLAMEASVHGDAKEYVLAVEKLREVRDLGSPNLSAYVQDQIALAVGLLKLDRNEEALQEIEGALRASGTPQAGLPSPLDIQAAFVHHARISRHLGRDIPGVHRELFVRNAERLQIPRDIWEKEVSLTSAVPKAEEWLDQQSRRAVADSHDPLFRARHDSD